MWRTPAGVAYPLRVLDAEVSDRDILDLTNPAAIAAFFGRLGYDVSQRHEQVPENLGLGDASTIRRVERGIPGRVPRVAGVAHQGRSPRA